MHMQALRPPQAATTSKLEVSRRRITHRKAEAGGQGTLPAQAARVQRRPHLALQLEGHDAVRDGPVVEAGRNVTAAEAGHDLRLRHVAAKSTLSLPARANAVVQRSVAASRRCKIRSLVRCVATTGHVFIRLKCSTVQAMI